MRVTGGNAATLRIVDEFWTVLGTFKTKDWVTITLSIAALIVSVIAITQKSRHLPKPLIKARLWFRGAWQGDDMEWVVREIANRGNGTAHDLRIYLYHWNKPRFKLELEHGIQLAPGEVLEAKWGVSKATRKERVLITWRQAPNMNRKRRKRLRVKHVPRGWEPKVWVDTP